MGRGVGRAGAQGSLAPPPPEKLEGPSPPGQTARRRVNAEEPGWRRGGGVCCSQPF